MSLIAVLSASFAGQKSLEAGLMVEERRTSQTGHADRGFRATPYPVATDPAPQQASNNATAASRCSSDNELLLNMKLLPVSQN